MTILISLILLFTINYLLSNPKKLVGFFLKGKLKSKKVEQKKTDIDNLKLSKSLIKDMIKENFLLLSDYDFSNNIQSHFNMFKWNLENYLLYKYKHLPIKIITYKIEFLMKSTAKVSSTIGYVRELKENVKNGSTN